MALIRILALLLVCCVAPLLACFVAKPALANGRSVEVRILERRVERTLEIQVPRGTSIQPAFATSGRLRLEAQDNRLLLNGRPIRDELRIGRPEAYSGFGLRIQGQIRQYPGMLRARAEGDRLILVNVLPLEAYVAGVVSAEMPDGWPPSALEAQAVLARTLALNGGNHPRSGLCDLTHCQVYAGQRKPAAQQAAQNTAGQVLTYRGGLIQPLYHSTCGGERASNAVIFGGTALPYLQEGADPHCAVSPHAATWHVRVLPAELARALGLPRVERVEVRARSLGGWVAEIEQDGRRMSGYRFWQAVGSELGWGVLKSMRFTVRREGDAFVFEGKGLGHGVGLCQWGARGQAARGVPYRQILASYYPGTALGSR